MLVLDDDDDVVKLLPKTLTLAAPVAGWLLRTTLLLVTASLVIACDSVADTIGVATVAVVCKLCEMPRASLAVTAESDDHLVDMAADPP